MPLVVVIVVAEAVLALASTLLCFHQLPRIAVIGPHSWIVVLFVVVMAVAFAVMMAARVVVVAAVTRAALTLLRCLVGCHYSSLPPEK